MSARAEQGLLASLGAERHSRAKDISDTAAKLAKLQTVDLKAARAEYLKAVKTQQKLAEFEEVASLKNQPLDPAKAKTEFPKIASRELKKRTGHDKAIKGFEAQVAATSEEVEAKVLEASRAIQKGLEVADSAIADAFTELNNNALLVTKEHTYLLDMWASIDGMLWQRNTEIKSFGDKLEGLERDRSSTVGAMLRELVDELMAIAYKSPGEIERYAEGEAFELNTVLIANRKCHAGLLAMLDKKDVAVGLAALQGWRARQEAWRTLRHERAIGEFHTELRSKAYTNPPARRALLATVRAEQEGRHEQRLELLHGLGAMRSPALQSNAVIELKANFKSLYEVEEEAIGGCDCDRAACVGRRPYPPRVMGTAARLRPIARSPAWRRVRALRPHRGPSSCRRRPRGGGGRRGARRARWWCFLRARRRLARAPADCTYRCCADPDALASTTTAVCVCVCVCVSNAPSRARYHDKLHELKAAKADDADERRESLRAELHVYGALEEEPDLEARAFGSCVCSVCSVRGGSVFGRCVRVEVVRCSVRGGLARHERARRGVCVA